MKNNIKTAPPIQEFAEIARRRERESLRLLRQMVECESPSGNKLAVDGCLDLVAYACRELGGRIHRHRQKRFGNLLEVRFAPSRAWAATSAPPLLLLGHLDTVWPLGTLRKMPFRRSGGRVWGPGVLDMKAGVMMALNAVAILRERESIVRPITLLLNSEEEVGSPVSRPVTERLARQCGAVFVLEPAQGLAGAYKTSRKGIGDYTVRVTGVAAHAGVDFGNGHSAILELGRQLQKISTFTDLDLGLTVNPGVIGGGTQPNVIAAEAWTTVDFRFAKAAHAKKIEHKFQMLRPIDNQCGLHIEGGVNRPPMERTKGNAALFRTARTLAAKLGFDLHEASTGGGSDGNFTSAIGVSTLDGMGAIGEGAHANNESVLIEHLAPRTALLAAMMMKV